MVNEYKRIVLLKGLLELNDNDFSSFKSLMNRDLRLKKIKQEEYTKSQIADMMEDEFPTDAGLGRLIEFCDDIPSLKKIAETLKEQKSKVEGNSLVEIKKQEAGSATPTSTTNTSASDGGEISTAQVSTPTSTTNTSASDGGEISTAQVSTPTSTTNTSASDGGEISTAQVSTPTSTTNTSASDGGEISTAQVSTPTSTTNTSASDGEEISTAQNQNTQTQNKTTTKGAVLQKDTMTVMVIKAIDPFVYKSSENEEKKMFHAALATVNQYFHAKVFNVDLKQKFTKENVIIISNYFKFKEILEINEASCVMEADPCEKIEVSNMAIRRKIHTPTILDIFKYASGELVYGLFTLYKKKVNRKKTTYEIKDDTGCIEVVGDGKWHNINCEEGDKLQLFCFQRKTIDKKPKLVCCDHSFIKVDH